MESLDGKSSKIMNVNEKLFTDCFFKLLQMKKKEMKSECLPVMRELIRQSQIHCSEQKMTPQGAERFKLEFYSEYHKIMDSEQNQGLLPVICDSGLNDISHSMPHQYAQHTLTDALERFKSYLFSSPKAERKNRINLNPGSSDSARSNFHNNIANNGTNYKPFITSGRKSVTSFQNNAMYSGTKVESINRTHQNNCRNEQLPKKNKLEEQTVGKKRIRSVPNTQSNKTNTPDIGFVSAKTMYRNPMKQSDNEASAVATDGNAKTDQDSGLENNEALKNFDKKIVETVLNEVMEFSPNIKWSDIAGLEFVKSTVQEIVIWPLLRPDIFTGLRAPPRGILLFGPPGTGKTLIGKCIATESNSTFFCISASSLASKWVGESEKMVRVLFAVARLNQPAVIFIDEIDALLSQRSDKEQDFTRKLKTEFLVQFDGAKTNTEERVLVVGATNRPHELDEAARRRFVKRLYVPLPDASARQEIIKKLLKSHQHNLSDSDLQKICDETKGYSGSDVAHLCKEAAMGPIRCIGPENIKTVSLDQVRPISLSDFTHALRQVRASVAEDDLNYYLEWNKKFGSFGIQSL